MWCACDCVLKFSTSFTSTGSGFLLVGYLGEVPLTVNPEVEVSNGSKCNQQQQIVPMFFLSATLEPSSEIW
jgi:hypothetical protein